VALPLTGPASGARTYTLSRKDDIERVVTRLGTLGAMNASQVANMQVGYSLLPADVAAGTAASFTRCRSVATHKSPRACRRASSSRFTIKGLVVKAGLSAGVKADAKITRRRRARWSRAGCPVPARAVPGGA
jgi:hypothetical protein